MSKAGNRIRELWFDATPENIEASYKEALALSTKTEVTPAEGAYMESLAMKWLAMLKKPLPKTQG